MPNARLVPLLLIAATAWAQHSGGFRSGGGRFGRSLPPVRPVAPRQGLGVPPLGLGIPPITGFAGGITPRGFGPRYGFHNRRFNRLTNGYFPFLWDFPALGEYYPAYPPPDAYPPPGNTIIVETTAPPPPPPPQPVRAEIREYKWNTSAETAGEQPATFTIVLKDGSRRYPVAAWIEKDSLHYIDSEGHHAALAASTIDRDTTERLNREKKLNLQLPPS